MQPPRSASTPAAGHLNEPSTRSPLGQAPVEGPLAGPHRDSSKKAQRVSRAPCPTR